jgi:hypothetical protein
MHALGCEFVFVNRANNPLELSLFQALGDYLLRLGLTTEGKTRPSVPFNNVTAQNINVRFVGGAPPEDDMGGKAEVVAPPGAPGPAGGEGESKRYRLCFAPIKKENQCINYLSKFLCGQKSKPKADPPTKTAISEIAEHGCPRGGSCGNSSSTARPGGCDVSPAIAGEEATNVEKTGGVIVTAEAAFIRNLERIGENINATETRKFRLTDFANKQVSLTFYLRSVEQMIAYLGLVARAQLNSDPQQQRFVFVKNDLPNEPYPEFLPCENADNACEKLFVISEGSSTDLISAEYKGRWFSIPVGQNDYSSNIRY